MAKFFWGDIIDEYKCWGVWFRHKWFIGLARAEEPTCFFCGATADEPCKDTPHA